MEDDKPSAESNIIGYVIGGSIALVLFLIVLFFHLRNSKHLKSPLPKVER
jgi:hypothetical protein